MAVFKLNICKFNNCNLIFNNLENLIRHIEANHINYDPKVIEQFETQQPTCLPLSYVLRFFADPSEGHDSSNSRLKQTLLSPKPIQHKLNFNVNPAGQKNTSTRKTIVESGKKSNRWVSLKTSNCVLKNLCKMKRTYKCHCGKTFGSSPSLKKHAIQCHNAAVITAQVREILQGPNSGSLQKLMPPYSSLSLKQISSTKTPLKTLIVSNKSASNSLSALSQQPQRLMIQLSDLKPLS